MPPPAPQPVHAQMKRKHRSKSSRSKHAQRGTERGYTQVAHDAVMIAGMIEDLDDWQGENARESRRLQKRRGQVAAQIHVVNCRGRALADKEGQLAEQLAQASSRRWACPPAGHGLVQPSCWPPSRLERGAAGASGIMGRDVPSRLDLRHVRRRRRADVDVQARS